MVIKHKTRTDDPHANIHLCHACDEVLTGKRYWKGETTTGHHLQPRDFFTAVEQEKCWACLALRAQLSEQQYESLKPYAPAWDDMRPRPGHFTWITVADISDAAVVGPRGSLEFHIMFHGDVGNKLQEVGRQSKWNVIFPALYLWAQPLATIDRTKLGVPAGDDTFTPEAWLTAKQWIEGCSTKHDACNNSTTDWLYPTRLLDVGQAVDIFDSVRLIDTTETMPKGSYLTLSHCWGSEPFLTLRESNLDEMKQGIQISLLNQTFQDAIEITRRMKIRYIWIDSLCIIQDGPGLADWERESVKMGEYYSHAFCNISATASSRGAEGLCRKRDHTALQHAQYNMPPLHGRLAGPYSLSNVSLWATQLDEAPLHRRAWVLQERLLARRVLHFGQGQLLWECREHTASEMYPHGLPKIAALQLRSRFKNLDPASLINQKRFLSTDKDTVARQLWHHISKEYSRCLLTYSKDKTRALEGVVKLFEGILGDEYVHGFWKKDLHHQILWRVQDSMYPPRNRLYEVQHEYPLPTWSWLSSDCPLLSRENPPGSSTLQEEQLLFEISEIVHKDTMILNCRPRHAELQLTTYGMFKVNLVTKSGTFEAFRLPDVYLDGILDDVKEPGDVIAVVLLPARISFEVRHTKPDSPVMLLECLLVQACEEQETYKRVGLMRVQNEAQAVGTLLENGLGQFEVYSRSYDPETRMHEIALV